MLTNNKIKLIKSLDRKKSRTESGCFVVEGEKMVRELLQSRFETVEVFAVQPYIDELPATLKRKAEISAVSERDLERISFLKTSLSPLPTPRRTIRFPRGDRRAATRAANVPAAENRVPCG